MRQVWILLTLDERAESRPGWLDKLFLALSVQKSNNFVCACCEVPRVVVALLLLKRLTPPSRS